MSTFGLAFTSALLDFVWQGALVAVVLLAAVQALGGRSARVRYALYVRGAGDADGAASCNDRVTPPRC